MSNRLKELNEKRGAKLKEASAIVKLATETKRELTADEQAKVNGLQDEADQISQSLMTEARQMALEGMTAPSLSVSEEQTIDRFSLSRLIRHMDRVFRGQPSSLDGVEAELVAEGEREAREARIETSGVTLPRILVRRSPATPERRDMSVTGGTTTQYGGNLVSTQKIGLADDFYNGSILRQNGAMVLEGLIGNLGLPRYSKASDPTKKTENESSDELTPTIPLLSLSPKRLPAHIDISDQLLVQSAPALEAFLRSALTRQMLAVQEKAFFHGNGTSEATGIAATSGIGSVAGGTNGAAPDWADIVGLEREVDVDNAAIGALHYMSNSKVRAKLKQTAKISSTDSYTILDERYGNLLNGYVPLWTNAISSTLTKGNQSLSSAIFFGNVNDYVIGYWGGLSLEIVRDKALAIAGQRTLVAQVYYDGGVLRPVSFAAMLDALTA